MATGNMTVTTLDAFIPDIWSKEVIYTAVNKSVMAGLVRRDFDGEISEMGNTVKIPIYSEVTVSDKTANTAVIYTNYTETTKDIVINKHKTFAFRVDDIAKVQAKPAVLANYAAQGGLSIAKQVDVDVSALITAGDVTQNVGTMATAAWGNVTDALLRSAIQKLDEANAPEEDRYLIITPAQKNALLGIDKFVEADKIGDNNVIRRGLFGQLYGVLIYVSNNLPTVASVASSNGGAHVHDYKGCCLFQKNAFGLAIQQQPRVQSAYDIDYLATSVVGDVLYGVKTLQPTFACQIRTGT